MEASKKKTSHPELEHSRNVIAAISSIIPGLGHIYKAHYSTGFGLLIFGPFIIWAGLMLGWATFGIGLFIPLFFMIGVGWHAYSIEDRRGHAGGIF
jgi:hypothetical protein